MPSLIGVPIRFGYWVLEILGMSPVGEVPAVVVGGGGGGGSRKGWEREEARLVLILMRVRGRAGLGAGFPLRTLIAALLLLVPPSYPNPNHLSPPRYLHPLANSPNNDNQLTSDLFFLNFTSLIWLTYRSQIPIERRVASNIIPILAPSSAHASRS
jgi:hypothetical protein